ncbi:hypothetical protein [Klebsiella phage Kpn74]|uniref:Uncharacterized protein n=1 Tax=Klebsiella phage Kpn74 TaxID=3044026 RepID=A0AAT9V574_9CAUD|nr:hypothetical protein [Klebsiella phage Kpn74]
MPFSLRKATTRPQLAHVPMHCGTPTIRATVLALTDCF